jgi:hypothetical protein
MSPASLEDTTQGHSPKQGSLENPEVLENVPGHVIPILEREFDDFDTEAAKFLRGERAAAQGSHHHAAEHPGPPHSAGHDGRDDP